MTAQTIETDLIITAKIKTSLSLWEAIKIRIAGKAVADLINAVKDRLVLQLDARSEDAEETTE